MDGLIAAFMVIGTFIANVFGNIVAHDLCEFTPKLCRRLIDRAIRCLPDQDRERYSEEWLAHLAECTSVYAQYKHAMGCIFGARRLNANTIAPTFKKARVEFQGIGFVDLDYSTGAIVYLYTILLIKKFAQHRALGRGDPTRLMCLWLFVSTLFVAAFKSRHYGRMNSAQFRAFIKIITRAINENNNKFVLDIDGRRWDFKQFI